MVTSTELSTHPVMNTDVNAAKNTAVTSSPFNSLDCCVMMVSVTPGQSLAPWPRRAGQPRPFMQCRVSIAGTCSITPSAHIDEISIDSTWPAVVINNVLSCGASHLLSSFLCPSVLTRGLEDGRSHGCSLCSDTADVCALQGILYDRARPINQCTHVVCAVTPLVKVVSRVASYMYGCISPHTATSRKTVTLVVGAGGSRERSPGEDHTTTPNPLCGLLEPKCFDSDSIINPSFYSMIKAIYYSANNRQLFPCIDLRSSSAHS